MTEEELNNARILWKMVYARNAFDQTQEVCDFFLEQKFSEDSPAYYSLLVAIHVLYARPFVKSFGGIGKLTDDIVPEKFKKTHTETLNGRSRIYAHTDANAPDFDDYGGSANQVRFIKNGGAVTHILLTRVKATAEAVKEISILCQALQEITSQHIDKLRPWFLQLIPREDGEYVLNVSGIEQPFVSEPKQFFIK